MFDTRKTRMIGLPSGEEIVTMCQAVSLEYRNVTDGQTDRVNNYYINISRVSVMLRDMHVNGYRWCYETVRVDERWLQWIVYIDLIGFVVQW